MVASGSSTMIAGSLSTCIALMRWHRAGLGLRSPFVRSVGAEMRRVMSQVNTGRDAMISHLIRVRTHSENKSADNGPDFKLHG